MRLIVLFTFLMREWNTITLIQNTHQIGRNVMTAYKLPSRIVDTSTIGRDQEKSWMSAYCCLLCFRLMHLLTSMNLHRLSIVAGCESTNRFTTASFTLIVSYHFAVCVSKYAIRVVKIRFQISLRIAQCTIVATSCKHKNYILINRQAQ